MKEYITLYKGYDSSYYPIYKVFPSVWHLNNFLEGDYRLYDKKIFTNTLNYYDTHFVYNDFQNRMMYIEFAKWLVDEDVDSPP